MRASPVGRPVLIALCVLAVVGVSARAAGVPVPAWTLLTALLCLLGTVGVGVTVLASGVFARPILAAPAGRTAGRFALTFDDGPHPAHTRLVADILEARGHRGTFFVIGSRVEENAALVAALERAGHRVENHSFSHPRLGTLMRPEALCADLRKASAAIESATGRRPRLFRPPVGLLSPPLVEAARLAGLDLVGWSGTARDGTRRATPRSALARLLPRLRPGAVLVLHDGVERGAREPIAAAILPALLDEAEARGLRSIPLDQLLAGALTPGDR